MTSAPRPAAAAAGSHMLQLDARRTLRVPEAGAGAPVVLIHGALATAEDMAIALFDRLSPRFGCWRRTGRDTGTACASGSRPRPSGRRS